MISTDKSERRMALRNRKLAFFEAPGPAPRQFFLYRPTTELPGAPLVVSVHGIARNAAAHAYRLMEEGERYGLVIAAPLFEKAHYGQYQQLEDASGARSDLALLDIAEAAARLSAANPEKLLLFGYSGGAQFAHRFALVHPGRVASAVLVGAGWYTFPDPLRAYPRGLDTGGAGRTSLSFDVDGWLRVPQHVMVGEMDIERDSSLRQSRRLDRDQGETRLERARRWVEAMGDFSQRAQVNATVTFSTLPGVGHSFTASVERACLPKRVFSYFAADIGLAPLDGSKE